MINIIYVISNKNKVQNHKREAAWLTLVELVLVSTLKLLDVEEDRVAIGEGVSFFCSPLRICCPLTDIVISLLQFPFLAFCTSFLLIAETIGINNGVSQVWLL